MTHRAERATVVIAVLVAAIALHLASEFLIPVALGLLLVAILWPVVQQLVGWRVPASVGAPMCIVGIIAILAGGGAALGPPVRAFANELPKSIDAARPKLAAMSATVGRLTGTHSGVATQQSVKPDSAKQDPWPT
ncbi:MAG: AI-2E family transporter [Gemmatimonas sp.]